MYKPEGVVVKRSWRAPLEIIYQDCFMHYNFHASHLEEAKKELYLAIMRTTCMERRNDEQAAQAIPT